MTNHITIEGRLAQDPELRFAANGTAMCNISVPDQKRVKNRDTGEWEDASATTWFRVTVFKDAAEALAEAGRKGDEVVVTGRLITREWQDKDGNTRSNLEVDYATVALVPRGPRTQRSQGQEPDPWATSQPQQQATQQAGGWDEPSF